MSISIVEIKMAMLQNTNNLYELNLDTFQLPEGIVPLDILYRIDYKTMQSLSIPIWNTIKFLQHTHKFPPSYASTVREVEGGPGSKLEQLKDSIQKNPGSTHPSHLYNLHSKAVSQ